MIPFPISGSISFSFYLSSRSVSKRDIVTAFTQHMFFHIWFLLVLLGTGLRGDAYSSAKATGRGDTPNSMQLLRQDLCRNEPNLVEKGKAHKVCLFLVPGGEKEWLFNTANGTVVLVS